MTTALSFIFTLGVLIFIHELGHFVLAKWVGIRVDRFSMGFPPNIVSYKRGETEYCIGIIPLGGYVKMAGENPDEASTGAPDEFMSKSVLKRTGVIFAGPFMNYVLAVAILSGIFLFHGVAYFDQDRAVIGEVVKDMPAAKAGIKTGDQIIAVNDQPVQGFESLRNKIVVHVEEPVELTWVHGADTMSAQVTTQQAVEPTLEGGADTVGVVGIGQQVAGYRKFSVFQSMSLGFNRANFFLIQTAKFVKQVVVGEVSAKMIGGPIFIAQQSGKEAERGLVWLFGFMALLSVNLAVLNVLPIPVLDGGQLVFLAAEKIKGKPLSMKTRMIAQQIGIVALLALVIMVTYNDIMRVIGNL
jgi:regulator of sigma E protease